MVLQAARATPAQTTSRSARNFKKQPMPSRCCRAMVRSVGGSKPLGGQRQAKPFPPPRTTRGSPRATQLAERLHPARPLVLSSDKGSKGNRKQRNRRCTITAISKDLNDAKSAFNPDGAAGHFVGRPSLRPTWTRRMFPARPIARLHRGESCSCPTGPDPNNIYCKSAPRASATHSVTSPDRGSTLLYLKMPTRSHPPPSTSRNTGLVENGRASFR